MKNASQRFWSNYSKRSFVKVAYFWIKLIFQDFKFRKIRTMMIRSIYSIKLVEKMACFIINWSTIGTVSKKRILKFNIYLFFFVFDFVYFSNLKIGGGHNISIRKTYICMHFVWYLKSCQSQWKGQSQYYMYQLYQNF